MSLLMSMVIIFAALARERDELLALLDVKERLKYEQNRQSTPSDEAYSQFSSNEVWYRMSVLCNSTGNRQGCKLSGIYRNSGISPCFFQCGVTDS
jgi:hypothetical protein